MTTALIKKAASAPRSARAVATARASWPEHSVPEPAKDFVDSHAVFFTALAYAHLRS